MTDINTLGEELMGFFDMENEGESKIVKIVIGVAALKNIFSKIEIDTTIDGDYIYVYVYSYPTDDEISEGDIDTMTGLGWEKREETAWRFLL